MLVSYVATPRGLVGDTSNNALTFATIRTSSLTQAMQAVSEKPVQTLRVCFTQKKISN
jgi:hypothetical protein